MAALDQHHLHVWSPGEQLPGMPIQLVRAEGGWSSACAVGLDSCVLPDLLQPCPLLTCALSVAQCCAKSHPVGKLLSSFSSPRGSGALTWDSTTAPRTLWGPAAAPLGGPVKASFGSCPTSSAQTCQTRRSSVRDPPSDGRDEVTLSNSESNHINIELGRSRLFPESHGTPCHERPMVLRAKDTEIKT